MQRCDSIIRFVVDRSGTRYRAYELSEENDGQVTAGPQRGALKMREWKMQERQSMESHQKKILLSTRRNMAVVAFLRSSCQTQLTSESTY